MTGVRRGEAHGRSRVDRMGGMRPQVKEHLELPGAARGKGFSLEISDGAQPCWHFNSRFLASGTVRE